MHRRTRLLRVARGQRRVRSPMLAEVAQRRAQLRHGPGAPGLGGGEAAVERLGEGAQLLAEGLGVTRRGGGAGRPCHLLCAGAVLVAFRCASKDIHDMRRGSAELGFRPGARRIVHPILGWYRGRADHAGPVAPVGEIPVEPIVDSILDLLHTQLHNQHGDLRVLHLRFEERPDEFVVAKCAGVVRVQEAEHEPQIALLDSHIEQHVLHDLVLVAH
mmetsp:Transcript_32896/g.91611  ORF Transcript_32896/g.91611 Transcript_32896/m.91611 type:complete len:216 (-) Transcript_32896:439-1086(-)